MLQSRFRLVFVLAALLLVTPAFAEVGLHNATAQTESAPPLAEAMPADTALFVSTEFDPTSDEYLQVSALTARLLLPRLGDAIAGIVEKLTELLALIPSDVRTVLEGDVGIGITGFGQSHLSSGITGGSLDTNAIAQSLLPGYAIVLHPLEAGSARQLVMDWFTQQVAGSGFEPMRTESGSVLILSNPDPAAASSAAPSAVAFSGDYILLGASVESLAPFVAATQGEAPTMADSASLNELNAALPAERLFFGYVSAQNLLASLTDLMPNSKLAASIDPPFGETAFTVAADEPGYRFESVSVPLHGLSARGAIGNENPNFASRVPDTTLAMLAGTDLGQSWAIQQLQKVLLSVLAGTMGGAEVDLSGVDADAQFGVMAMLTGVNFKTDLMDQLQGNYGAALFSVDTSDPYSSSAVVASELEDPDRTSVAVTSLGPLIQTSGAGAASVTTASVDGQTVNNVSLTVGGRDATIQYGVVDDMLMVGLGDGVSTLATAPVSSLADSAEYQQALAELPGQYDGVIYLDLPSLGRELAPVVIDALAANSDNALADCLAGRDADESTPEAAAMSGNSTWSVVCSVVTGLLGGTDALQNLVTSRLPGPLAAVSYEADGLQHVSGILLIGSD